MKGRKGARNLCALSIEANDEEAWDKEITDAHIAVGIRFDNLLRSYMQIIKNPSASLLT